MKTYAKLITLLAMPLVALIGWYFLSSEEGWEPAIPARADFSLLLPDTQQAPVAEAARMEAEEKEVDTASQRILLFGDSMVEGLKSPMARHAAQCGHELTSVVWYSSNTHLWADTDTLQHFIREARPTYILICLGSNQLFVRDLQTVDKNIATILSKTEGIPCVWISPPNWKDDTGINELIIKHMGSDRYFDSRHLTLARRKDHAHPTAEAAVQWADTICNWLSSLEPRHPVRMAMPENTAPMPEKTPRFPVFLLQPVE